MKPRRALPFTFATLAFAGYLFLQARAISPVQAASAPLRELTLFSEAFHIITSQYFDTTPLDAHNLIEGAIEGMLDRLGDPHTHYLPPVAANELMVETEGEFGGLGIVIGIEEEVLTVISPIEGTPAWEAGLTSGDRILEIDDTTTKDMPLPTAVSLLRGPVGTRVTIQVERGGVPDPFRVTLTRARIEVASVKGKMLDGGIAYIRISSFTERTPTELDAVYNRLAESSPKAYLLDMRDNPGGVLSSGIAVADRFIDSGLIVEIRSRNREMNKSYLASRVPGYPQLPMAVLVNGGSASAAEIVAGAIRDHHRGRLFGQKTYGKGSVQSVLDLSNGAKIAITSARYFTPSGVSIHGTGIVPDDSIETEAITETDGRAIRAFEERGELREFGRGHESYNEADLDRFAGILADSGIAVERRFLARMLASEISRHHSTKLILFPELDRPLAAATRWLKVEVTGAPPQQALRR